MDSDDCIAPTFVEELHKQVNPEKDKSTYIFPLGYNYLIKKNLLYQFFHPANMFVSVVSFSSEYNIYTKKHAEMAKNAMQILPKIPMWCFTLHNTNYSNIPHGTILPDSTPFLKWITHENIS